MKKRILLLCPHPEGVAPGQRLKYEQYFPHWEANGFEIVVSPFMTRRFWNIVYKPGRFLEKALWTLWGYAKRIFDLARLPFYDGTYIFLWVTPFGTSLFERLARGLSRRLIYDIDDLVFLGRTSEANGFIAIFKGPAKMHYLMKAADHVITCTPYLDQYVRKYNAKTTDISSTIDTAIYRPREDYRARGELTLGWSGSHSTSAYLMLLRDVLLELGKVLKFKLLVIGDPAFGMAGIQCEALPWRLESEVADLHRIDIGLYPLPDEQWVQGKSGLKALQYMALGIPTVASAVGANFRVIDDGKAGFLAHDAEEWKDNILALAQDLALRETIGRAARERVVSLFSVTANQPVYLNLLQLVYGRPSPAESLGTHSAQRAGH